MSGRRYDLVLGELNPHQPLIDTLAAKVVLTNLGACQGGQEVAAHQITVMGAPYPHAWSTALVSAPILGFVQLHLPADYAVPLHHTRNNISMLSSSVSVDH
ncbi:hypothetical protein QQ045_033280 [Rhodiola kirilowii]